MFGAMKRFSTCGRSSEEDPPRKVPTSGQVESPTQASEIQSHHVALVSIVHPVSKQKRRLARAEQLAVAGRWGGGWWVVARICEAFGFLPGPSKVLKNYRT